ncbi:uncharacterized protein LOC119557866 [Drosophila subpulchrella]|uniref:uncharacterized protein LOC119557866 n=1 Tax=Drosophila subpulchrella TaxID=1486046 RepID=UPI0018A1B65B|nr:uncharacterized protein LOC119557866 [Drosophila subpulchrella]
MSTFSRSPKMLGDLESVEKILPAEIAATGGGEKSPFQENRMEMARKIHRGKGRLCMIFRLGKHPRCEFTNGFPPADPNANAKRRRSI